MIIPGILTDQLASARQQLDQLAKLTPRPEVVQIDIVDGEFADELTIDPSSLSELDRHNLSLDLHLMCVEPIYSVEEMAGLSGIRSVIGQVERMSSQREFLESVRQNHWLAGLSLNLYTPLEAVEEEVWEMVDILQIMGGEAGSQGQKFHPSALAVIQEAVQRREELAFDFRIMVDIGLQPETIALAQAAGADDFVVGSYLTENVDQHWQELQKIGRGRS